MPVPPASDPATGPDFQGLRRVRTAALAVLGLCGVLAFAVAGRAPSPLPTLPATPMALGAALLSILLRRAAASPRRSGRSRHRLAVGSVAAAAALGAVGVLHSWQGGPPQQALLFVLAGALFALAPVAPAPPGRRWDAGGG